MLASAIRRRAAGWASQAAQGATRALSASLPTARPLGSNEEAAASEDAADSDRAGETSSSGRKEAGDRFWQEWEREETEKRERWEASKKVRSRQ